MTTLVTGAAGFVGSHVTQALLKKGERVVGIDNLCDYYAPARKRANLAEVGNHPSFRFVEADIRDPEALRAVGEAERPGTIIHLAAMPGIAPSMRQPVLYQEVNGRGTLNVLELARGVGARKFVFASTSSVYGDTQKVPFVEGDPTDRPLAPYPATKKAGELLCFTYHHLYKIPCAVLRFFNVYGPRGRPDMAPWKFTEAVVRGETFTLYDAGRPRRDWTFVDDVVAGVVAAAEADLGFEVLNLGRGAPVTMREFVTVLERLVGQPARWRDAPLPATDLPVTYADTTRAREVLGYTPRVDVEEGLGRFWAWYREAVRAGQAGAGPTR
jgi:UDP-glucuronate 4-epimerase